MPDAVNQAMAEFDALGRDDFLRKYGFGNARRFYVEHEGRRYDSKALLGAAHRFQFPEQGPLASADFSGGEATTVRKLRDLGFTVVAVSPEGDEMTGQGRPLSELIPEVFELQHAWTDANTPEMKQRGTLIRELIPEAVQSLLPKRVGSAGLGLRDNHINQEKGADRRSPRLSIEVQCV